MKKEKVAHFKEVLLDMKDAIVKNLTAIEDEYIHHSRIRDFGDSAYPIHLADIADDVADTDLNFKIKSSEEHILHEIDAALKRIEEGTYGLCTDCGELISDQRLDVMPYAVQCMHCKEEYEKNHKTK